MASADREPIEQLAEEWRERWRRGEQFSVDEYIARCPELADEIRQLFPAIALKARRASAAERFRRWWRRHPVVAGLTLSVFVLLACCAIGSTVAAFWLHAERDAARAAEDRARKEEEAKTEKLYESYVAQANASRFSRQVGQRFATLDAIRKAAQIARERNMPPARFGELRNLAIAALALPDWRLLRDYELPQGSHFWDWDDRGERYAFGHVDGHVSVRRLEDAGEIGRVTFMPGDFGVNFNPSGRFLLAAREPRSRIWDLGRPGWPVILEHLGATAWHPDGRHLAMQGSENALYQVDLTAPKEPHRLLAKLGAPARSIEFNPAGTRLAMIKQGSIYILDIHTGVIRRVPAPKGVQRLAWHPRGNFLALVYPPHTIHVWDLTRNQRVAVLEGCRGTNIEVAFTANGELLVSKGWEGKIRFWNWRTGQQVLGNSGTWSLRMSPDGRMLIANEGRLKLIQLAGGAEYRSLVRQSNAARDPEYRGATIHANGRVLAAGMTDGVRFWDLATGDEVAHIPTSPQINATRFVPDGLITAGNGLLFWPIRPAAANAMQWRVGPPQMLLPGGDNDVDGSKDGQILALPRNDRAFILRRDRLERPVVVTARQDARWVGVSPDGTLVATGAHNVARTTDGVKLWDAQTGRFIKEIPVGAIAQAAFSPNGKWLAVRGGNRAHVLAVSTWKETVTGRWDAQAFSPDSRLLAVESGSGAIRLLDPATGHEKARLDDPNQDRVGPLRFTPDGTRLVAVCNERQAIHVWDLRLIRQQLADLGLDWDDPPFAAVPPQPPLEPLRITIAGADLIGNSLTMLEYELQTYSLRLLVNPFDADLYVERGRVYRQMNNPKAALRELNFVLALAPADRRARFLRGAVNAQLGRWTQARDDFTWLIERSTDDHEVYRRRAECRVALGDDVGAAGDYAEWLQHGEVDARTLNAVAWRLVGRPADRPAAQLGAADLALPLVQNALAQAPTDRDMLHTLGVTYYRLGRFQDAIEALERLAKRPGDRLRAFELYFLAMCHHKLGDKATAQREYDDAIRWQELAKLAPAQRQDLQSMRAEAEAVLGLSRKDG